MLSSHTTYVSKKDDGWLAGFRQSHYMFHAVIIAWELQSCDRGGDGRQREEEWWTAKRCNVIKPRGGRDATAERKLDYFETILVMVH